MPQYVQPCHNLYFVRFKEALYHVPYYSIEPVARLAKQTNIPKSTLIRLLNGKCEPDYDNILIVTRVIEKALRTRIDPRQLISNEKFIRPICNVCKCPNGKGCLPDLCELPDGSLNPAFSHIKAGTWMTFADFTIPGPSKGDSVNHS